MTMTADQAPTANTHGTLEAVRFGDLAIAPENVRAKDQTDTQTEIETLAESIFARGLLKNLVGYREGDLVRITAGRRRWKAHAWLASVKGGNRIDNDHAVAVLIRDRENAVADSLAENTGHKTMTTAQEIAAYRVLAKDGKTEAEIARTHGTAVLRVRMLLRLATVAPMVLKAFNAEEINLDTLKAFAVRDDHKRQRAVFKKWQENPYAWRAYAIRDEMLLDTLDADDPIAVFIGTDAYTEAGGRLDVDLFSNTDTAAWLDVDLANRLAREKIDAEADTIRETEGWKWSRVELDQTFTLEASAFARVYPERTPFSDAAAARMEALEFLLDDEPDNPKAEAEWHEIEGRYAAIYPAQAHAIGGFILALNGDGGLTIERGLIRAEDAPAKIEKNAAAPKFDYVNPNAAQKGKGTDGSGNAVNGPHSDPEADKPLYTAKHRDRLTPIRRAAFQEALAGCPALAFDLTAFDMARAAAMRSTFDRTPLNIRVSNETGTHPGYDYDEKTPFYDGFLAIGNALPSGWLGDAEDADKTASLEAQFAAFRAMPKADKERWLAFAVAASADIGVTDARSSLTASQRFAEKIALEAKADIRTGWTPDIAFFNFYRKAALLDILSDLLGGTDAEFLREAAKMPKGKLVEEIALMFSDEVQRGVLTKSTVQRVDAWRPLGTAFDGAPAPQKASETAD